MRARPAPSVRPLQSTVPRQSFTATCASATGRPRSSVVTHTRLDVRPRLKCTPRLVTSAAVRTYIDPAFSSSALPSTRDSTSTTCSPVCGSGRPTTSVARGVASFDGGSAVRRASASPFSALDSRPSHVPLWNCCRRAIQRISSASGVAASSRFTSTWPPVLAPCRSACTWRSVIGSAASGPASTMPKAPENLASGGSGPVATSSGKAFALASARPASSRSAAGSVMRKRCCSGSGAAKRISLTQSPGSAFGSSAAPCAGCRRAASAAARATGALKRTTSGRSGMQGAPARSRSQLNSASRRGRTFHSKPRPQARRTRASAGNGRSQATTSQRAASSVMRWLRSTSARGAPSITRTGMRSARPSTSHQAPAACFGSAAPLKRSRNCCCSSMRPPG